MNMPGFGAESALYTTSRRYRSGANHRVHDRHGQVTSQLAGALFGGLRRGGGLGTLEDYWPCKDACESAYSACLDTCEGTWENPQPSRVCMLCDDDYRACMAQCSRDIA